MRTSKLIRALLYTLTLFLLTSCQWFTPKDEPINRSLLMYMAITSNLKSSIMTNIQDVKASTYVPKDFKLHKESGDVLLFLEHHEGDIPRLKRLYTDEHGVVNEEILMEYEGESSIDPEFMNDVLVYANTLFPAKESGLIFSSHGTGWTPVDYYRNPTKDGSISLFSIEEDPYAHLVKSFGQIDMVEMDIIKFANAIPRKYSYIIFDACLMGGIEVAYELKEKAEYIVFSPTEIMAAGFPYSDIVEMAFYSTAPLPERMMTLAKAYYDLYNVKGTGGGCISVVKTENLSRVAYAAQAIFAKDRKAISSLDKNQIQKYYRLNRSWFYDITHFMQSISSDQIQLDAFYAAMNETVIAKYATEYFINVKIDNYSGVSTYIPYPSNTYLDNYYKGFSWNKATNMIE